MDIPSPRVLVLCANPGVLINYSAMLNAQGYFHLSLCASACDIVLAAREGIRFDFFIYDDCRFNVTGRSLMQILDQALQIGHFLAISDMGFGERRQFHNWARSHNLPLRTVLPCPLREEDLNAALAACQWGPQESPGGRAHA